LLTAASQQVSSAEILPDFSRTPVVFVHGHGMGPGDWDDMIRRLVALGYPREYLHAVEIRPSVMGNVAAAENVIDPAVTRLLDVARDAASDAGYVDMNLQNVDIVSHSMGAVSSRWYAAKIRPDRVRVWISIGGANRGTDRLCAFSDEGAADLCPAYATDPSSNSVQLSLNGLPDDPSDETPWGTGPDPEIVDRVPHDAIRRISYFTIRIDPDAWIRPASSATLRGAGDETCSAPEIASVEMTGCGNFLILTGTSHDDMPKDEAIIALVEWLLT
jgi:pimeloyl-ACP methyl ester carboxylesterase